MPYIGNKYEIGDHNNSWKTLDDISSYVATFDGSATNAVSTTNNTIRVPEHRFIQGQRVTYSNGGGGNIGGLTSGTAYYIIHDTNNEFKLATSLSNANASTAINLSAVGTGTSHTLTAAFDGINKKFKITKKSNLITYMPRKLANHSTLLLFYLKNLLPKNWEVRALDNLSEKKLIYLLSKSKIFLSFSNLEGIGIPPIEAALSGNKVIGYTGAGGEEYWKGQIFKKVESGEIADFGQKVLKEINNYKFSWIKKHQKERKRLAKKYSEDLEKKSLNVLIKKVKSILN